MSKIDTTLRLELARVTSPNPLSTVELGVDLIFMDNSVPREPGKPLALEQNEIGQAILGLFQEKQLNRGELFPLAIREGKVILKISVANFEALAHASTSNFGIVDENTIFRFKVN